ncbi:hypothetical protein B566_EDAN011909 [Ephemera danica]|nr:hypothetical protein B566_EDAN011909 [Ephemera danica]
MKEGTADLHNMSSASEELVDTFPESLTLGLIKALEETPGVQGVEFVRYLPCERMSLTSWEQREVLPIGNMRINQIADLRRIGGFKSQEDGECPTPLDVEMCHQQIQRSLTNGPIPNFGTKCKIFELDPCQGLGKVCLVYQNPGNISNPPKDAFQDLGIDQPKVWLLDRCFEWHFIAEDFTTYFRMMLVHKGLPQWQFKFTPIGLTPWAEQMFAMLAPQLLQPELDYSQEQDEWDTSADNLLDPAIFKLKSRSSRSDRGQSSKD